MYEFVTATLKKRGNGERLTTVNISLMTMEEIFSTFEEGYITLTNNLLSGTTFLNIKTLKTLSIPMRMTRTFENWLQSIGSLTLPSLPDEPVISTFTAKYSDAVQAGYKIERIHPTLHPSMETPEETKTDLLVTRLNTDMELFLNRVLVTVSGLCHITDSFEDKVRVIDGGKTCLLSDNNTMGLISFNDIGDLVRIPIEEAMLVTPDPEIPFYQTVWINLGIDLTNKSVILSLGGYLHIEDNAYKVINSEQGIIQVNFETINLYKRIFESRRIIDLSSLELTLDEDIGDFILTPEIQTNEFITKYLTLSQSFVIVVDAPVLYIEKELVEKTKLMGTYLYHERPMYPLRLQSGILPEYWYKQEYSSWTLNVVRSSTINFNFESTRYQNETLVTGNPEMTEPYRVSQAHLLKISCQKTVFL